jgi:hypothetical protein
MTMKKSNSYSKMTTAQLRQATRQFDEEIKKFPPGRALTAAQKKAHQQARRRGRPRVGEGSTNVQFTIEQGLLRRADKLAQSRGVTRSQLIAESLKRELRDAG